MIYKFRNPEQDEQLLMSADPAEGGDYSAFVVLSKKYADVVMCGRSKEESSQLGYTLNHIGLFLKKHTNKFPLLAVERNTGTATLYVLKQLNYQNLYKMPKSFSTPNQEDQSQFGWSTNTATRPKMLDDLALAIRQKAIKIPSKVLVDELFNFIRNEKTGKPEAEKGCHDDLVISLAIAWQLYQTTSSPIEPYVQSAEEIRRQETFRIGDY